MAVIKAHFDGKVFVPDEPVDLPKDQPVTVLLSNRPGDGPAPTVRRRPGTWPHPVTMTDAFDAPLDEFEDQA